MLEKSSLAVDTPDVSESIFDVAWNILVVVAKNA